MSRPGWSLSVEEAVHRQGHDVPARALDVAVERHDVGDDELWRRVQERVGVLHPELVGNVAREDILFQAEVL
jgi:hypothetical protein